MHKTWGKILSVGLVFVGVGGLLWWGTSKPQVPLPTEPLQQVDDLPLQIDLGQTLALRQQFAKAYERAARQGDELRDLYEEWIGQIGANGIIKEVERITPVCHDDGHDLGKVIYAQTQNVGTALQVCDGMCYSGCMHGVLMEAFGLEGEAHAEAADIQARAQEICEQSPEITADYSPGDCYHGLGHAFMYVADYDIPAAMAECDKLATYAAQYYCATGGYMEYMNRHAKEEYKEGGLLTPCVDAPYPAACFRYRFPQTLGYYLEDGGTVESARAECAALTGAARLGCYHGFGNGLMSLLVLKKMSLREACSSDNVDEQAICVDGAMERAARYYPERAKEICAQERGELRHQCSVAIGRGMYSMERDFSRYER